jgi:hypothetical protein
MMIIEGREQIGHKRGNTRATHSHWQLLMRSGMREMDGKEKVYMKGQRVHKQESIF